VWNIAKIIDKSHSFCKTCVGYHYRDKVFNGRVKKFLPQWPIVYRRPNHVRQQAVLHSDETGFQQGNRDGRNPESKKGYL
jgi:hypothetical protein